MTSNNSIIYDKEQVWRTIWIMFPKIVSSIRITLKFKLITMILCVLDGISKLNFKAALWLAEALPLAEGAIYLELM